MDSRPRRALAVLLLLAPLAGCRATTPAADSSLPAAPPPREEAWPTDGLYRIDPQGSTLLIHVFRGGRAARLGHNHVISAPQLSGEVQLPGDDPAQARFVVRLRFDELAIDAPALRAATGGGFAGERSASDIEGTRRNLLKSVDAERYPEVLVRSQSLAGDWPILVADVAITLHGVTRVERLRLHVEHDAQLLRARGNLAIRQRDFGIEPYSLLGGLLAVQDAVAIDFELVARAAAPR